MNIWEITNKIIIEKDLNSRLKFVRENSDKINIKKTFKFPLKIHLKANLNIKLIYRNKKKNPY